MPRPDSARLGIRHRLIPACANLDCSLQIGASSHTEYGVQTTECSVRSVGCSYGVFRTEQTGDLKRSRFRWRYVPAASMGQKLRKTEISRGARPTRTV